MPFIEVLFLLFAGHFVCDYALQTEYMDQAKNQNTKIGKKAWIVVLPAHAFIHALAVYLITHNMVLTFIELFLHATIDWLKCNKRLTFYQDQSLHLICKLAYAVWFVFA